MAVDGQWIELETWRGGEGQGEKPEGQAVPLDCVGRMRVLARRQSQNCQKKLGFQKGEGGEKWQWSKNGVPTAGSETEAREREAASAESASWKTESSGAKRLSHRRPGLQDICDL